MLPYILFELACLMGAASAWRHAARPGHAYSSAFNSYSGCPPSKQPKYSAVVVFGASYCDNAHPRAAEYSFSVTKPPYWEGRFSNGPVFDEYTDTSLNANLINYAYGGAHANNKLTLGYVPSTRGQLNQYIADVGNHAIDRGNQSVLHIWWIGINPLKVIISTAFSRNAVKGNDTANQDALAQIDAEIAEVTDQVATLRKNTNVTTLPTNVILLPIPPLEVVPDTYSMAVSAGNGSATLIQQNAKYIKKLSDRYNKGLVKWVHENGRFQKTSGWVKTYDIPSFWRDLFNHPGRYGFTETVTPCYNSTSGSICSNPDQWVQWDSLHPTTAVHKIVGGFCTDLANQCF